MRQRVWEAAHVQYHAREFDVLRLPVVRAALVGKRVGDLRHSGTHALLVDHDHADVVHCHRVIERGYGGYAPTLTICCTSPAGGATATPLGEITESTLLNYVRHQLNQELRPTPQTVNHRLGVLRCLYQSVHKEADI